MIYKLSLTENQVNVILRALSNEATDDAPELGEYSFMRCYNDFLKKVEKEEEKQSK